MLLYFDFFSSPSDFPQSDKLILCLGNMWSEVFTFEGVINKAIQVVARKRSRGQVLKCLKTVLNWEEVRWVGQDAFLVILHIAGLMQNGT